jgi:DNA-binding beta-propeller fold protein YncE
MKFNRLMAIRFLLLISLMANLTILSSKIQADTGTCGGVTVTLPFTDVMGNAFFCQIASAYFSGLTNGTTATTYSPGNVVTREQMAAFTTRTLDQSLRRGSRRSALNQFWATTPRFIMNLGTTDLVPGNNAWFVQSDGEDLWVALQSNGMVARVRASDGKLLETWTGALHASAPLVALGRVFITGGNDPGALYMIDPSQPAGMVTTVASSLGKSPLGIAFDGTRIWTANTGNAEGEGSISIITPDFGNWQVTTISTGFSRPQGILFDGSFIWVTDVGDDTLKKLDSMGNIIQTLALGEGIGIAIFDGTNIWVPSTFSDSMSVVRAVGPLSGTVLATLTGNGLDSPFQAAFDGERILVTNPSHESVSLWKATDFSPLGTFSTGTNSHPFAVCSDGVHFWITLNGRNQLGRF